MKTDIWENFNKELNIEAKRVVDILVAMYKNKKKVNKQFGELLLSIMKEEYKNFSIEIELKVIHLIPDDLTYDSTGKYPLKTRIEDKKDHIIKYCKYAKKVEGKDLKKISKTIATEIIDHCNNYPKHNESINKLICKYIKNKCEHYDSVDLSAIMLFIQEDIEKYGYIVKKINPLVLQKV